MALASLAARIGEAVGVDRACGQGIGRLRGAGPATTFREIADPEVLERNQERFRREAKRYAEAIKVLRKNKGLKQSDIAGLSERQVRRLEAGLVYPHSSTLDKLAVAHDLPPAEYVRRLARMVGKG